MNKVYIFGHRNPDTDSVTSAVALEYLKKCEGVYAEARVLGEVNDETKYILKRFNVKCPKYLNDVKLQIRDIMYHKGVYKDEHSSLEDIYNYMNQNNITGVPIVDKNNKFLDMVTAKMVLKESFDTDNDILNTSYDNILKTLNGERILLFDEEIKGRVNAVTYKSTTFIETFDFRKNDILIIGDRHSIIETAIYNKVKLIIITGNCSIKEEHLEFARENKVNIIRTPFSSFKTVKKIMLSNYVKTILTGERDYTILDTDYYDDFLEMSKDLGHNNYPVVDKNNNTLGLLRLTDVKNKNKKKVILVDHNELSQSAQGLIEAEILEVIDHHKIGDISTNMPINFRNMAVGSTNTIIYYLYKESRVEIPKQIASLMLGGIMSDTLALTSPTTTETDRNVVKELEKITGLNYKEYALDIFNSSMNIDKKTDEELINSDIKEFQNGEEHFRVSQITIMNAERVIDRKEGLIQELNRVRDKTGSSFVILMVTDILKSGCYMFYSDDNYAYNVLTKAIGKSAYQGLFLDGVVSRKKQIIPLIMEQ